MGRLRSPEPPAELDGDPRQRTATAWRRTGGADEHGNLTAPSRSGRRTSPGPPPQPETPLARYLRSPPAVPRVAMVAGARPDFVELGRAARAAGRRETSIESWDGHAGERVADVLLADLTTTT